MMRSAFGPLRRRTVGICLSLTTGCCCPATFKSFSLSASMDGQWAIPDYVMPGDVLELMEHMETHLRQLP